MKERSWNGNPYITVGVGKVVNLFDPQPEDFDPELIAYRLAGIFRYTGGSRFSVAQHCVIAAEMAGLYYPNERFLPARMLIHDADEAFYGDVSSPLKSILPEYVRLEEAAQIAVEQKFDLMFIGNDLVDEVDLRMWLTERSYGVAPGGSPYTRDYSGELMRFDAGVEEMTPWSPDDAQFEWLAAWRKLFPWMQ
jgi:hypothetical protein